MPSPSSSDTLEEALISVSPGGETRVLQRHRLGSSDTYTEAWLRDLVFDHPAALPLREIDPTALPPLPVCTELDVGVGRIDAVFIDRRGRLTLVEFKLWQNPEARRKVVAQILDYAAALASWSYGDLQRQVARRLGKPGNALFDVARSADPSLDEASFVDGVSRSLREGDFTLLVLGDGIRRETHVLNEYLQAHARLRFRFGLVEIAPYQQADGTLLLHPRVRARTEVLTRPVAWTDERRIPADPAVPDAGEQPAEAEAIPAVPRSGPGAEKWQDDVAFWTPFLETLRLDDPEQPIPHSGPGPLGNRRFPLPMNSWLTAYRVGRRGNNRVGVQFRSRSDEVWDLLEGQEGEILAELPEGTSWTEGYISHAEPIDDIYDERSWPQQRRHLRDMINTFINVFRPRLK